MIKPKYDDIQMKPGNTSNQSHTHSKQNTMNDASTTKHKNTQEKWHFMPILA